MYAREREREREEMAESGSRRGRFSRSGDQIRGREKTDWMAAEEEEKRKGKGKQAEKKAGGQPHCFGALLTSWRSGPSLALATMDYYFYLILFHS